MHSLYICNIWVRCLLSDFDIRFLDTYANLRNTEAGAVTLDITAGHASSESSVLAASYLLLGSSLTSLSNISSTSVLCCKSQGIA